MSIASLPTLLAGVTVSFASGFGTAWYVAASDNSTEPAAISASSTMQSSGQPAGMNQFGAIWSQGGSATLAMPSPVITHTRSAASIDEQKLLVQAQSDPAALRNLIQRYDSERDPNAKAMLRSVLSSVQKPEVVALTARLTASADVAQRREGYELLQSLGSQSPEAREVVKQALANEQSPEVLVQALSALTPAVVTPTESEGIVSQLRHLAQHYDPNVRSQSLLQLSQWDKTGAAASHVSQALTDSAQEVRQAAIFAVAQSGTRSDAVKASLLRMINDVNENKEVKGSALQVLERFSLTQQEYAGYNQVRSQLGL